VPTTDVNCVEDWLSQRARRLLRRPMTAEQLEAYIAQWRAVARDASDVVAARNALVSMVLSPYFVFRIELGTGDDRTLAPFEVAARISHFAARMAPDEALLDLAERGMLDDPLTRLAEYQRLSQSPPGALARVRLVYEWLGLQVPPFRSDLPPELTADMTRQAQALIQDVFDRQAGSLQALLTTPRTFVNQRLAEHYGLAAQTGDELVPIDLDQALASGILTTGVFLTQRPTPSRRGFAIETAWLGASLPQHPGEASVELGPGSTPRERLASAVSVNAACRSCHDLFDPPGLALEAYDDQGRATGADSSGAIGLSSARVTLANPAALGRALAQDPQTRSTAVRRYLELALDRKLSDNLVLGAKGVQDPPPIPILREDPDLEWLRCVTDRVAAGSPEFALNKVAEVIVTSQGFGLRGLPPRPAVAFDVNMDPFEHARQEALTLAEAFASTAEQELFRSYAAALRDAPNLGVDPGNAAGAGGNSAAGSPNGGSP
jgi:hypothetical protein